MYNTFKLVIRRILRQKYLSLISIIGLTLGITVALLIAHIAYFELSFDRFNDDYTNIYRIQNNRIYSDIDDKSAGSPPALGPTLKIEIPEIIESARINRYSYSFTNIIFSYTDSLEKRAFFLDDIFYADNSVFNIFSYKFITGNPFKALEAPFTAVVTRSFAAKYFTVEKALGRTFDIENDYGVSSFTITGVINDLPANSHFQFDFLLSFPTLAVYRNDINTTWGWNAFNTYVRLAPGSSISQIDRKLSGIINKYQLSSEDYSRKFELQPLKSIHLYSRLRQELGENGNALLVSSLIVLAVFILIVAWLNHVNITLAKSSRKIPEICIRKIHGISNKLLFLEHTVEAFILNGVAVILSSYLIYLLSPLILQYYHYLIHPIPLKYWIYLISILLSGTVISGIYTGVKTSRLSFTTLMKGFPANPKNRFILKNSFVILQYIISITFIIATITGFKQLSFMTNIDLGCSLERALSIKSPKINGISENELELLKTKLTGNSQISSFTSSSAIPGLDYSNASSGIRKLTDDPEKGKRCFFIGVDENYFRFFNIDLIAGRSFSPDFSTERNSVILNQEALKTLGFNKPEDAIGEKIIYGGLEGRIKTVVGVIQDYHHKSLKEIVEPVLFDYIPSGSYYSIKTASEDYQSVLQRLKGDWNQVFPDQPFEYFEVDRLYRSQYNDYTLFVNLLRVFTMIMILIACLGLYTFAYFTSLNRTKEIGIRKVNGARMIEIMGILYKDFIRITIIAFILACPVSWFIMHKWLQSFAYRTELNWWIFALAGVMALVIALLTVSWQSWRAASRNPVEALRYE